METIIGIVAGLLAGLAIGYLLAQSRAGAAGAKAEERARSAEAERERADAELRSEREARMQANAAREAALARAAESEKNIVKLREEMLAARQELQNAFAALSQKALQDASNSFLDLAKERFKNEQKDAAAILSEKKSEIEKLVNPIKEQLGKLDDNIRGLEQKRSEAYGNIHKVIEGLTIQTTQLRDKTTALTESLRGSSQARGRWGEVQLKNLVELAGMVNHCDFEEQAGIADGGRPDVTVNLPGDRKIAIDAKAPLAAYLDACAATDDKSRKEFLKMHADALKLHIRTLASRSYWDKLDGGVDFVVLFLPGDSFLSAAFESDGTIVEYSWSNRVLIATPVTLLALLKTLALYWQQSSITENAKEISEVAKELYARTVNFIEPVAAVGRELKGAVDAYNKAVASFEGRVVPFARKLEELGSAEQAKKMIPELQIIDVSIRSPRENG
ncbi:MAG: DNA recombination protein RmuC [Planctomycetota bacterium]